MDSANQQSWLVTGAGGMLGQDLAPLIRDRGPTLASRQDLDVTDVAAVEDAVAGHGVVVHLAAWTDVDGAESDPDAAMTVNGTGTRNVAAACARHGARLIHISTDYVFDGQATTPYPEDHPLAPVSAYGRSKAAAEDAVRELLPDAGIILRTAWLYGAHGRSFPTTIKALLEQRDTISVVDDQTGQPTWTADLARRIVEVGEGDVPAGRYHATNAGSTTWFTLARAVAEALGTDPERVQPTTSAQFVRPAPRPAYSVLAHDGWARAGLPPMRHWADAFAEAGPTLLTPP